jgi:hypothetical protein
MSSGDMYAGVPQYFLIRLVLLYGNVEKPKSISLMFPFRSIIIFESLMSPWTIPFECRKDTAFKICKKIFLM